MQDGKVTMFAEAKPYRYVRPATLADVKIADRLRPEDIAEILAGSGLDPKTQLTETLKIHDVKRQTYAMLSPRNNAPFGLFGTADTGLSTALIWLVSTPEIEKCSITFLRESRKWITYFHSHYKRLWNWVDARQTLHIKWLTRWLGFYVIDARYINGHKFYAVIHLNERRQPIV